MKTLKRLTAAILCLVAALFAFAACGGEGGENENGMIVLRFWNGFTGKDGETMDRIVENFNREYQDEKIMVTADKIPWDTLFTKITATGSNIKTAPHIVAMSANRIAGMVDKNILQSMNDVEEYLNVSGTEYLDQAWAGGMHGENRYGFPIDVHPTAMFYNKNLISEEELPTTWEQFREVCIEKTREGVYGFVMPSMYSITKDIFASMLSQNGGALIDASNDPVYNSQAGVDALQFLTDLVYRDKVSPKDVGAGGDYTLFVQGKSVFYFDGPWISNTFGIMENPSSNIGVAPMPGSTGENGVSFAGSHQFTLMKKTVTTDRTREACYTFMRYVNEHSLEWAKAGQVPALKSVHESQEYKALTCLKPFTEEAYRVTLGKADCKYFYEAYNGMGVAVSNAISNTKGVKAALDDAVSDFKRWREDEEV